MELIVGTQEDAAGVRETGGRGGQLLAPLAEERELPAVGFVLRIVRAGEMTDQQLQIEAVQPLRLGDERLDLAPRQAEPAHARVQMHRRRQRAPRRARMRRPQRDLAKAVENGDELLGFEIPLQPGLQAVEDEYLRARQERAQ